MNPLRRKERSPKVNGMFLYFCMGVSAIFLFGDEVQNLNIIVIYAIQISNVFIDFYHYIFMVIS
jgi:tryptophan-rich sensory protein